MNGRFLLWSAWSLMTNGRTRSVPVFGSRRIVVRCADFRAYRVASLGGTQREKVAVFRRAVAQGPEIVLDVGANYGEFVAGLPPSDRRVLLVEANPLLVECLQKTFRGDHGVSVVCAAAAESPGECTFHFNPWSSGSGSLAASVTRTEADHRFGRPRTIRVPGRTVDDLVVESLGSFPRSFVLKIDVEGAEPRVLRGARRLLSDAQWGFVLCEFNPQALAAAGEDPAMVWSELRRHPGAVMKRAGLDAFPTQAPSSDVDVVIAIGSPPVDVDSLGY